MHIDGSSKIQQIFGVYELCLPTGCLQICLWGGDTMFRNCVIVWSYNICISTAKASNNCQWIESWIPAKIIEA